MQCPTSLVFPKTDQLRCHPPSSTILKEPFAKYDKRRNVHDVDGKECLNNRASIVELQRQGIYGLRECRRFEFHLLEAFLREALPTIGFVEGSAESGRPKRLVYLVDMTCMPVKNYSITADRARSFDYMVFSEKWAFTTPRAHKLIRQYEEDDTNSIQLACSIGRLCEYSVATIATFLVRGPHSDATQKGEYHVDFLNGFVTILDSSGHVLPRTAD
ncbi:hypothetical protein NMY22_g8417 [Coprinellus aureogranulatus]|nr:hypothetical protein NMY22_g8417 [Coprinellus aureogranulatus]